MNPHDQFESRPVTCKICRGAGVIICFACSGKGLLIKTTYGFPTSSKACSACGGTGIKRVCTGCGGKGFSASLTELS